MSCRNNIVKSETDRLCRRRGRPRRRWMDGVKGCLSDRGLTIPEGKACVKDRREWRHIVSVLSLIKIIKLL